MAGKRDLDADVPAAAPEPTPSSAAASASTTAKAPLLPVTVMLSRSDGDAFEAAVRVAAEAVAADGALTASFHIEANVENMVLRSELMGDASFPKLWMHRRSIFVLGSGQWATLLKAQQGKAEEDWQLYLMSKGDVYATHHSLIPPNQVRSRGGYPKSLPFTILQDPAALYLHTYKRKCPGILRVAANKDVFLT